MGSVRPSAILTQSAAPSEQRLRAQAALAKGNLRRRQPVPKLDSITVRSDAQPPEKKLETLLKQDWQFRRAWERQDRVAKAQPTELLDYQLTLAAGRAGWQDQELADLLAAARQKHGESLEPAALEGYVTETLRAVRSRLAEERTLREASTEFAGVFLGQFLKAMRSTVKTGEFGYGGKHEATFQALLDSELANEAARGDSYGLTDLIYRSLAREDGMRSAAVPVTSKPASGGQGTTPQGVVVDVNA